MHGTLTLSRGINLYYTIDDYTDPWREPETVLLVHGLAESGEAWRAWIPRLAAQYRVVRVDQRGFGRSTPMPADHRWSLDELADDLATLMAALGCRSVHVIGAKIGAAVSAHFVSKNINIINTLTLIGLPLVGPKSEAAVRRVEQEGARVWARATMEERLGKAVSPAMLEGWSNLMGGTPVSTLSGFMRAVSSFDVRADLPTIRCPVLAITSDSALHPVSEVEAWRARLPDSEMVVVPGDGYHASASQPEACVTAALDFIRRRGRRPC